MIVNTEAIILSSIKFGDTSKIFTCYSHDEGKINLIAKGSRQLKSKVGSALEPLSHSFLSFYKKPTRDLYLLSKAELITNFKNILSDLNKLAISLAIAEAIKKTQEPHTPNIKLFELILSLLNSLNSEIITPFAVLIYFHIELAKLMGISLSISEWNLENHENSDDVFISIENSSILTNHNNNKKYIILEKNDILLLQRINKGLSTLENYHIEKEQMKRILNFFYKYFSCHLETNYYLNSLNIAFL